MALFEWDPVKARTNRRKHGFTFENAVRVFDDPCALSLQDRIVDGELRWQITGLFEGQSLLTVAYVVIEDQPDEVIRIVSARRSTRLERRIYEETRQKNDG